MLASRHLLLPLTLLVASGCSEDDPNTPAPGTGGGVSTGGVPDSGSGGVVQSGGMPGSGGTTSSGGAAASSGGAPNGTGGTPSTGGSVATGGTTSGGTGGSDLGSGGAAASGGAMGNVDCASLAVCDDFESGTPNMAPDPTKWTTILDYGLNGDPSKVVIDTAEHHSGGQSVKVDGQSGVFGFSPLVTSDTFYLRTWMKVPDTGTSTPVVIGVNEANGGGQPDFQKEARLRIFPNGTDGAIYFSGNDASDGGLYPDATDGNGCPTCTEVPTDWFCVEMHFDATAPSMTVWIDGTEAVSVPSTASWNWPSKVDFVRLGVLALGGNGTSVWFDDVAMGDQRLGCD